MLQTKLALLIDTIDLNLPWLVPFLEEIERTVPLTQRIVICAIMTGTYLFFKTSKHPLPLAVFSRHGEN